MSKESFAKWVRGRRTELNGKLDSNLIREITIKCADAEEKMRIGMLIHDQLKGNQDYIDCNIILNVDAQNTVKLYIFKECKEIPQILI